MAVIIIMQGLPGSGKGWTIMNKLIPGAMSGVPSPLGTKGAKSYGEGRYVVSADFWFENEKGEYEFDPKLLGEAHAECLRSFVNLVQHHPDLVIVDNTNTTVAEIAPYYAVAQAFRHSVRIHQVPCDPEVAFARNQHGVPREGILAMQKRLDAFSPPPWWQIVRS